MSFRPIKSSQRYLSLDLNVCKEICPDWLLVFLELLRQQKIQGLSSGDKIEMRKPIWDAAGVATLDRRKKIMNRLEQILPRDIVRFERRRGKTPNAVIGAKMAKFHSKPNSQVQAKEKTILAPVSHGINLEI